MHAPIQEARLERRSALDRRVAEQPQQIGERRLRADRGQRQHVVA
jgi:hypothetical protein